MDRHFLSLIESKVCIASIDEPLPPHTTTAAATNSSTSSDAGLGTSFTKSTIESLRLILAQKFNNHQLNFRELPVSLLRLYFSGRQRLSRFISRLPQHRLNTLVHFLELDGLSLNNNNTVHIPHDTYTDPLYHQKCQTIEDYLKTLLDYCFCSFEVTLSRIIQALQQPQQQQQQQQWYRFGLLDSLQYGSHWVNFPIPEAVKHQTEEQRHYSLWLTCVWRINTTLLLCKLVSPWDDDESKEWVTYQCKLFRDTHLDLLSMMLKKAVYDDEGIATNHHLLRDYYPACNRVCCAEELPDLVGYATDNFKTGSNLKERSTLDEMIGHLYVNKTGPNICKIRNFYDIIIRYGEENPIIYDILKNVIKCVLLGNLPHSRGILNMVARIKINLSFFPEEADVVIPEEVFKELTKNKSMKRNRSKKKTKDELVYTKTKFILWLLLCRHFVLYLLKEFLFYIAESSQWFNELLSVDYKFIRYREIVLIGNGQCRNKLSQQAREQPISASFDWSVIEFEEKSKETYDTKSGEIKKFHAWSLTVARKVQKDDFMKILAKKMTNIEECITISATYQPFYYISDKGEVASAEKIISLEELHLICWCMSKNKSRIMETHWFQVIGMSKEGLDTLRMWLFMYNTYDIPDNSLKDLIKEFYTHSAIDYMILKTVIKLIEYYKQEQVFHLPISYAKKQIYALRRLLGIEDWEPTPALLGYAYQCSGAGCHRFANHIIEPVDHSHKQRLLTPSAVNTPVTTEPVKVSSVWTGGSGRLLQNKENKKSKKKGRKRKGLGLDTKDKKSIDNNNDKSVSTSTTTTTTTVVNPANIVTSCFLNMAFYNMDDGKLYCSKYASNYKHTLIGDDLANGPIIMRKKDNSIIVRSNKTVFLTVDGNAVASPGLQPLDTNNGKPKKKYGQSSSQAAREREAKKFQWLLERRIFDFNDTNGSGGSDVLNDNLVCGLFAAVEEPLLDEENEKAKDSNPSSTTVTSQTTTKKNNKKIILGHVNRAISDFGLTCNKELTCIDMVGIVKNGKVRCVECGSMTEMKNYNNTNHGIYCGRHKNMYDSDYNQPPIVANPDKRTTPTTATTAVAYKKKDSTVIVEDSPLYQHNDGEALPITLINALPSNAILYRHHHYHHLTVTNQKLKNQLHPLDIIQKSTHFSRQSGHIEGECCAYCSNGSPKYRVTGAGHHKQIMKVALCKPCYDACNGVIVKHSFLRLSDIYQHLKVKRPL